MIEFITENFSQYLQGASLLAFFVVYAAGILASLTPCVYPVIPITVAFIGAQGSKSKIRTFLLALVYVTGLAVTYTILGGAAALSGKLFGQFQTNPWVYFVIANLCILMGLSMLGVFSLRIHTPGIVSRLQPKKTTEGLISSFLVGAASGLIVGPCTAPVLAVLLGYVAAKQNLIFGMGLLFVFAFGMGTLLIVVGTFAGILANMPRSGIWMTKINRVFGWLMIGAGEYFLIEAGSLWF
jgi:cytochrome c-type biogenesis protein